MPSTANQAMRQEQNCPIAYVPREEKEGMGEVSVLFFFWHVPKARTASHGQDGHISAKLHARMGGVLCGQGQQHGVFVRL
jgi:hypothetical protein